MEAGYVCRILTLVWLIIQYYSYHHSEIFSTKKTTRYGSPHGFRLSTHWFKRNGL